MFVKNNSARVITINVKGEKPYRTLPGNHPPVEISKAAEKLEFTQDCIKRGWLSVVDAKSVEDEDDKPKTEKEQLKDDLEALGVEVKSNWTIAQMKEELKKAVEA